MLQYRALVELVTQVVGQLFEGPLVLVDVIAERDFTVDVIAKQVDVCLALGSSVERRELEERLLDRSVVVHVDGVLEHVVDKVRTGLDEVINGRQHLQILSLLLVEQIELVFVLVELHSVDGLLQVTALLLDHLFALLDLFLLFGQLLDFLVYLLFHHLE